jgi:hypothetical protein
MCGSTVSECEGEGCHNIAQANGQAQRKTTGYFINIPYFSPTATTCQSPEIGKPTADKIIVVIVTSTCQS